MPKYIKTQHKERMFPFEFYDELSERLTEYIINNPAFVVNHNNIKKNGTPLSVEKRKELYIESQDKDLIEQINQHNILDVEPFGEVLALEPCTSIKDIDILINEPEKRSQIPLSLLIAQLYDSSGQPVFSKDVTEETIARIPEVLWDDPNLLLAVVSFGAPSTDEQAEESNVAVIRIPDQIKDKLFEEIPDSNT